MKTFRKVMSLVCIILLMASCKEQTVPLKVMTLNSWFQCTTLTNGREALVKTFTELSPDVIFLCELRDSVFVENLKASLKENGLTYYGQFVNVDEAILSKYPLKETKNQFTKEQFGAKATIEVAGQEIVLYSLHLDWRSYECYMPRGFSGVTNTRLEAPVTDVDSILTANRLSYRDEEISFLVKDAQKELEQGRLVILGGDFNEPSHLDWQEDTKNLRDHHGVVINWDCSYMLQNAGYKDAYREKYPNPVTHPAFTYGAGNKDADVKDLICTEGVDDRDRIDFIYYQPNERITLKDIKLVGPVEDFYKGKVMLVEKTQDPILTLEGMWPSDHKSNLAVFEITQR